MLSTKNKTVMIFFPGPIGGAEMIVAQGFKALIERNQNVELWMIGETRAIDAINQFSSLVNGLPTKKFQCSSIIDFKLIKNLSAHLQDRNITVIHAHGFKASVYAKLCLHHQKLILTHHGKTAHTLKVRIYEAIEEFIMRRADKVIAVSKKMQESLAIKSIKSVLIENFLTSVQSPEVILPQSPLKLIYVGRLSPEKGCQYLVEAMKSFSPSEVNLTIVGDGIQREELQHLANHKNTFFLGFRTDVSLLLTQHHVLVMPSLREGLPLTLIEATCNKLPVIASNVGGIPSLVTDQGNGILINPGIVSEIRDAISQMINEFQKFKDKATELAPDFTNRFSSTNWAKKTEDIYNSFNQE